MGFLRQSKFVQSQKKLVTQNLFDSYLNIYENKLITVVTYNKIDNMYILFSTERIRIRHEQWFMGSRVGTISQIHVNQVFIKRNRQIHKQFGC